MKEKIKKWLKPVLFTAGGALVGLAYYYFVGCPTGACPLTSNPFITMTYMGFIGWLLFGIFGKDSAVHAIRSGLPGGHYHLHIANWDLNIKKDHSLQRPA